MKKLYIVYVHITPDGMHYYGVTSQKVERRWGGNGRYYKTTSLQPYIEKYGWDNIQHIVLFRDQTKEDALWIEDFLIETAREDGVCINKQRSGLVSREEGYQRDYQREYKEKNREKLNEYQREYQREYHEKNREKLNEYQRDYQREYKEKNREKLNEYQRQYRQRKKLEKQLKEVETTPLF